MARSRSNTRRACLAIIWSILPCSVNTFLAMVSTAASRVVSVTHRVSLTFNTNRDRTIWTVLIARSNVCWQLPTRASQSCTWRQQTRAQTRRSVSSWRQWTRTVDCARVAATILRRKSLALNPRTRCSWISLTALGALNLCPVSLALTPWTSHWAASTSATVRSPSKCCKICWQITRHFLIGCNSQNSEYNRSPVFINVLVLGVGILHKLLIKCI